MNPLTETLILGMENTKVWSRNFANLQIPKNWYMNATYVSKIGQKNNEILPWIKIINFIIRTFTPIIYQNSYPITAKGGEVTENIIGIH